MKKIFFILFVIFTVSSCAYEDSGFRRISREEAMQSWAWKIFVYTDEGEIQLIEPEQNNFDNHIKEKPIFVEDIWEINLNEDLFLKNNGLAFKDEVYNVNFVETKRDK